MTLPPTNRYGPAQPAGTIATTDGHLASCVCGWLLWRPDLADVNRGRSEHDKKCKGAPIKAVAAPKRSAKADWSGREAATWIDQM